MALLVIFGLVMGLAHAQERGDVTIWEADGSPLHCRPNNGKGVHVRIRKEIHLWSDIEFASLTQVIRRLKEKGQWDQLMKMHSSFPHQAHGHDEFLPWHRLMLEDLETQLQVESNNCSLTLPFWNWAKEAGDIKNSIMWRNDRYGALDNNCISTGVAANWVTELGCLYRDPWIPNWSFLPDWANLMRDLARPESFSEMRSWVEMVHGALHVMIGGYMGDFRSPADPVFYAHHAFVDRLWFQWQRNHNESSCGECNSLHYNDHLGYNALDYAGEYDPVDNCIKYPASDPRICLGYTEHAIVDSNRRLSTKSPSKCAKLMEQLDLGECHYTEIASIPRASQCSKDLNATWTEGLHWLRRTSRTPDNTNQVEEWIKEYRYEEKLHPRRYVHASSAEEQRSCMVCDVVCQGKQINMATAELEIEEAPLSIAFRSVSCGVTIIAMLLFV